MPEFKPGDVVECMDDDGTKFLRKGSRYKVIKHDPKDETVMLEDGWYYVGRFRKVADSGRLPTPPDPVTNPPHYTQHPSGVECVEIAEHMPFNLGNAMKYLWRAGLKGDAVEDLRKAAWYVEREIARVQKMKGGA